HPRPSGGLFPRLDGGNPGGRRPRSARRVSLSFASSAPLDPSPRKTSAGWHALYCWPCFSVRPGLECLVPPLLGAPHLFRPSSSSNLSAVPCGSRVPPPPTRVFLNSPPG